ncbi:MAG: GNAT family N-acetyltransferase [Candidatus Pacebacteria bacterium]|nr:GNAT family N-acetyltransferase [Candidatus Paceibacterota bacterium]
MKIILKKADFTDIEFLFYLRNIPQYYKYYTHPRPVEWEEHINWIMPILLEVDKRDLYIIMADDIKAGQIRIDYTADMAEISVALVEHFRGKNIASMALEKAIEKAKKENKVKTFRAHVHQNNIASQKLFEKLGYQIEMQDGAWIKYVKNV